MRKQGKLGVVLLFTVLIFSVLLFFGSQKDEDQTQEHPLTDKIEITVICPKTDELMEYGFLAEMAEQDINSHMIGQGASQRFVFTVSDAEGSSRNAYDIAKQRFEVGDKLFVGFSWSSQLDAFLGFAKYNDCLIISPGSTQPWPWRLAPNAYRLYPADHLYTVPLVGAVKELNITCVIIVRMDAGFADIMSDEFMGLYSGEIMEILLKAERSDIGLENEAQDLEEEIINQITEHGKGHVAVYFISLSDQLEKVLGSATDETMYSVPWFIWDWYTWDQAEGAKNSIFENDPRLLTSIKLLGVHPALPDNPVYDRVNELYREEFSQNISMIHGNVYDGLWITALAVVETDSVDGLVVGSEIPSVAKGYVGVTGNCSFNDWGDRWGVDWSIYGYKLVENISRVTEFGFYNCTTGEITWSDN